MGLVEDLENLGSEEIALVVTPSEDYAKTTMKILEFLVDEKGAGGIYVTVNKPYKTLQNLMEDSGVSADSLFFIDAISKDAGAEDPKAENAVFLDSPQGLTDISIAVSQAVESVGEEKFIFIDSLSTLAIYNSADTVSQFAHFIIGKMRNWEANGVIIAMEEEADQELIAAVSQFCDCVIRTSEDQEE